jgi:hypothetical protein
MLVCEALSYDLREGSYRQTLEDLEGREGDWGTDSFRQTLYSWDAIMCSWNSHRPPLLSPDRHIPRKEGYAEAFELSIEAYRDWFKERQTLLRRGRRGILLKALQAASNRMPLVKDVMVCGFNDPHRIQVDTRALPGLLNRGHSAEPQDQDCVGEFSCRPADCGPAAQARTPYISPTGSAIAA